MAHQVALTHRTQYRFDSPISLGPHIVRLRPAAHCRTAIRAYSLTISPAQHFINWQQDPFGNFLARVVVPEKTREFTVTVGLVAEMAAINPFDFLVDETAATWPFAYEPELAGELAPYLDPLAPSAGVDGYLKHSGTMADTTIGFIGDLNRKLSQDIAYRVRMEPGVQTPDETLQLASGSCRDTGWLLVQLLRRHGLAARFVSGYLIQLKSDAAEGEGATGPTSDSADLHAWAEVYVPGAGWIGLDPTSGLFTGEGHIPLAATPSPLRAAPITGSHQPAKVDFSFAMDVVRVAEGPRPSRPYSAEQWSAILAAGSEVDRKLAAGDVRLTVGGEPTFVALDDPQAPEWNIAALGPTKPDYADRLLRRLRVRFGPGGLLHHGQGKWYPGEQVARWAYALYWRSDGQPLWRDDALIATASASPATGDDARRFAGALCSRLGVAPDCVIPAYEDAAYFALLEQKLPLGATPDEKRLGDIGERQRLVRAFERGLDDPAGYVLPLLLARSRQGRRWQSERWAFRRGHLFLVPGDAPAGLRLPLASLAEIDYVAFPHVQPVDPFAVRRDMPPTARLLAEQQGGATQSGGGEGGETVLARTALVVEPREGRLCIYLPPLEDGEDYAALVAAIEATAAALSLPVRIEGYEPPFDPRLNVIKITPDPGVVEVNVHAAASWKQSVEITSTVYEEALALGLGAEKFMPDGRRIGTGGGNHIVLGGATPAESPFLRRPDLLASIVAYWQTHPSLSYMFSGLFVGPTSQAPRADEGRHEVLAELEIAFAQLPDAGRPAAPWLIDRLFRNLLVDVTGNSHRAEICIDKLYSPVGTMGRLGLVEFRAFEMPPHAHMSLVEQLLIRAIVARCWEQPYRQPLVRWGTALHDRFMLPHFLRQDLETVVGDLRATGLPIEAEWFAPHYEFRCPRVGHVEHAGVELELRQALEPWLVLGEQSEAGATARPVDSSLERLQVRIRGVLGDRYVVTCNGYRLPLVPTGSAEESVAGVRFRAWQPIQGFHPTIRPHVPLVFDIVDTAAGRSMGGCRYHALDPAGRTYGAPPVNALEAEGRRLARFESIGHTPGSVSVKSGGVHADAPTTLDLRRIGTQS